MNRRRFGLIVLAGSAGATILAWFSRGWIREKLMHASRIEDARMVIYGLDNSVPGPPDADLLCDLLAVAEAVLPPDAFAASQLSVIERVKVRSETEYGYRAAVRTGITHLRRQFSRTGGSLRAVPLPLRSARLKSLMTDAHERNHRAVLFVAVLPPLGPSLRGSAFARRYVYEEILQGFFASAAGWSVVGYGTSPFACSGIFAYTQPPDVTSPALPVEGRPS